MGHLPNLITDLALILCSGAIVSLIFRKIKQPLVLGYIIAGFLVGPYCKLFPNIADVENIELWAEIGVIFLLFSLGLEFSFKKLINVGGSASITAIFEIVVILLLGYIVGQWMGWSKMDSIFLGGLLASSSTTIIIRAFEELGVKRKKFAGVVFGVLVVEDIVVILLMVILSTVATTQNIDGIDVFQSLLRLGFFLILWFLFGIFLIPTFLRKAKKLLDEETTLILSIGLCFGMVVLATNIGFSAELGAFVMGSILAETTSAEKIEHIQKPVKDLFGAVFFISIGMMIDPQAMFKYKWAILAVTMLTIFGKFISTSIGALISGQSLKQSMQVGLSMAQIGEFAFIVASLGISLNVTSDFLFPVAVGVSAITTFTTPYMIKYSEPIYQFTYRLLPQKVITIIDQYSAGTQNIQEESKWKKLMKFYLSVLLTNGIVIVGIVLIASPFAIKFFTQYLELGWIGRLIAMILFLLVCFPFLWAIMVKRPTENLFNKLWVENKFVHGPLVVIEVIRVLIAIIFIGFIVDKFFAGTIASLVVIPIAVLLIYFLSKKFQKFYGLILNRFMYNLNEREMNLQNENADENSNLSPWDSHLTEYEIAQNSDYLGRKLIDLQWREKYGINVVYIKRGDLVIHSPKPEQMIFPFDKLGIIGTDEQLHHFEQITKSLESEKTSNDTQTEKIGITKFLISRGSYLCRKTIKESNISEFTEGLVVGIERDKKRILNPPSDTKLLNDDFIWIVGNKKKIHQFIKEYNQK